MIERTQPIVKGVNKKGELVWGLIPMPYWQMAMFRVKYVGDFFGFWARRAMEETMGIEFDHEVPSMDISKMRRYGKRNRRTDHLKGD